MKREELVKAIVKKCEEMKAKNKKVEFLVADMYSDNGSCDVMLVESQNDPNTFVYGRCIDDNENNYACVYEPSVATSLEAAVDGMLKVWESYDSSNISDFCLVKVPRVSNDPYWIHPDYAKYNQI